MPPPPPPPPRPKISLFTTVEAIEHATWSRKGIVVVIDVFRTTSTIITALAEEVKQVVVVDTPQKCQALAELGFVLAGERDAEQLPGFQLGNSPLPFLEKARKGEKIALTSTNGTRAILAVQEADLLLLGGMLNNDTLSHYLRKQGRDILLLCAGYRGEISPEDLFFAGSLCASLGDDFDLSDSAVFASFFYENRVHYPSPKKMLAPYASTQRLKDLGYGKDIDFCLKKNKYQVIPYYKRGYIEALPIDS